MPLLFPILRRFSMDAALCVLLALAVSVAKTMGVTKRRLAEIAEKMYDGTEPPNSFIN